MARAVAYVSAFRVPSHRGFLRLGVVLVVLIICAVIFFFPDALFSEDQDHSYKFVIAVMVSVMGVVQLGLAILGFQFSKWVIGELVYARSQKQSAKT